MKALFITISLAFAIYNPLFSQLIFTNYASFNNTNKIIENNNNIWIATTGGILIRNQKGVIIGKFTEENGLPQNNITSLALDFSGNVWVGTSGKGIAKYDGNNWTKYGSADGLTYNYITNILTDLTGKVWAGTTWGIFYFEGGRWNIFKSNGVVFNKQVYSMYFDSKGYMWVTTPQGIYKFINNTSVLYTTANGLSNNQITKITENTDGKMIAVGSNAINIFDGNNWTYSYHSQLNSGVLDIYADGATLWFCTDKSLYKKEGAIWTSISTADGLIDNRTRAFIIDGIGNKWIGTYGGVSKLDISNTWKSFTFNSLPGNNVSKTIAIDTAKQIWVGSSAGLSKFDGTTWFNYDTLSGLPKATEIAEILIDKKNVIWMGTWGDGVISYNGSVFTKYTTTNGLALNFITTLAYDFNNNLWIGTNGGGVSKFNGTTFTNYTTSNGLINNTINDIKTDSAGVVWICTQKGISKYNGTSFTNITGSSLPDPVINAIAFDKNNTPWLGTNTKGIAYWSDNKWNVYNSNNGAFSDYIWGVSFDKLNNLWICYNANGIGKFDGKNWVHYTFDEGLASNYAYSIIVDHLNNKWITTNEGLSRASCENPDIKIQSSNLACFPDTSVWINISEKVDATTQYSWDIYEDGIIDYQTKNLIHLFKDTTHIDEYNYIPVLITANNDNCYSELYWAANVIIKPKVSLNLNADTISFCKGKNYTLKVNIENAIPSYIYNYNWNNGKYGNELNISDSGKYWATVETDYGCSVNTDTVYANITTPSNQINICMVTVDEFTGKNLVVWNKSSDDLIESYNIYKLYGKSYLLIGNVLKSELSVFEDIYSSPNVSSSRYAISAVDYCGNESLKSPFHQTIYLGVSAGLKPNEVVLNFSHYMDDDGTINPEWYYIYRGTSPDSLYVIDSISALLPPSWNDTNSLGSLYYQVSIKKATPCDPSIILKASGGPFSQSISNLEDNRLKESIGINESTIDKYISIYPNPARENIYITSKNSNIMKIELISLQGELLWVKDHINQQSYQLNINEYKGVILVKLSLVDGTTIISKIVVI